jgi:hypothetical protein
VVLSLSTGLQVTVFDSVATAMKCLESLRTSLQTVLLPRSDICVQAVSYHKLLVYQRTPGLQKLFSTFAPTYSGGVLQLSHKRLASVASFDEALARIGALVQNNLLDNSDLAQAALPLLVVDWNFQNQAASGAGSQLLDTSPLEYRYAS